MVEPTTDPLDISKEEDLVKDAQKDLSKIDVLVCGGCHEVFHFIEEFQNHKSSNECTNVSVLKCENEEKFQIWAFTLWKTKQYQTFKGKEEPLPSPWEIYQKWTKLDQTEKDIWISASKTLQLINKTSTGKLKSSENEKDPLALDGDTPMEHKGPRTGLRTIKDNEKEEYNVEKIIGKKFNPRRRYWEYEVKWENYPETTWEPLMHLENCKELVQDFENKLKAEREQKEKEKPTRGRGRPRLNPQAPGAVKIVKKPATPPSPVIITSEGRPQRTSKQKALNQVKAWCGNISDEEGGLKRPYDDDDESDDSFEKKMKYEGESEDTDDDEPKTPVRKVARVIQTYNNGTGKKIPDNVLIPDAKGVVRISQKQLPSLSSGVYIMSKSSGIIKLDPMASKIATSGGQAIVKVSPKIGQTQIKIIKKEDGSKRVVQVQRPEQMTATLTPNPSKPKIGQPIVTKTIIKKDVKKTEAKQQSKTSEKKEGAKSNEDDSDDGLPDLEFPTDLPLPEPESPPREFTLDPFTGKIAGEEYPEAESKSEVNEEKKEETPTDNLDNIVKLAAADITEEDLKSDSDLTNNEISTTVAPTNATPSLTIDTPPSDVTESTPTPVVMTVTTNPTVVVSPKTNSSILSTAIANSNILQKTLQSPSPRLKTQPRIINQAVAKSRPPMTAIIRTPSKSTSSPVPPKQPLLPKPKFNIASMHQMSPVKNVYSARTNNIAKKVGNTTVYRTKPTAVPSIATTVATTTSVVRKSPQKTTSATATTPKPISMPSLDEEPAQVVITPKVTKVNEVPTVENDLSAFTLSSGDRPMFITGDDGTVYQVAGQNEEGQTILVAQDSEGQQQCLLVTSEALGEVANPAQVLMEVQEPVEEQPLVAQLIRTEPPSPGGTHKVVVMLPDGDVMVTQVTPEEYASLELDK